MPSLHSAGPDVPMHFSAQLLADLRVRLLHRSSAQDMARVLQRMRHNMQCHEHDRWMTSRLRCVVRFLTAIRRISLPIKWYLTEWTCNVFPSGLPTIEDADNHTVPSATFSETDFSPFSEEELGQPPPYYDSDSPAQPSPGDSWFTSVMAPCVRTDCPCDSFNGVPGEYCCFTCRDGLRCIRPYHRIRRSPASRCARHLCPCDSYDGSYGSYCCFTCRRGTRCNHPYHRRQRQSVTPSVLNIVPDPRSYPYQRRNNATVVTPTVLEQFIAAPLSPATPIETVCLHEHCDIPTTGHTDLYPAGVCDLCFGHTSEECAAGYGACYVSESDDSDDPSHPHNDENDDGSTNSDASDHRVYPHGYLLEHYCQLRAIHRGKILSPLTGQFRCRHFRQGSWQSLPYSAHTSQTRS